MKDLYIIGAGGFGREVAWLVERINEKEATWDLKGFIDDNAGRWDSTEDGYPVLGGCDYLMSLGEVYAVCAIGSSKLRRAVVKKLAESAVRFASVIDPSVILSNRVSIGEGTIICAGSIVTVDIAIGRHNIINLDCTIGHDVVLNDFDTLYPSVNVSGNVVVGTCCELGTGAQIIQGKRIADDTIIGAGTVVVRDIDEGGTYVGNPARKLK